MRPGVVPHGNGLALMRAVGLTDAAGEKIGGFSHGMVARAAGLLARICRLTHLPPMRSGQEPVGRVPATVLWLLVRRSAT